MYSKINFIKNESSWRNLLVPWFLTLKLFIRKKLLVVQSIKKQL